MDLAFALLGLVLCGVATLWILGLGISQRLNVRLSRGTRGTDPITGPKDRIAIYDSAGPFIPMPDGLKTRDEMVAWMTTELPKLTAQNRASSS
jgi:hypothetical protein